MKRFALAAVLVILGLTAAAQQFDLSIDNIMRGNGLVGWEPDDLRWSPDGKRRALTQTTDAESGPQWTFDEKRVTFIRANNVYAADLASGGMEQLTNLVAPDDKNPLWDPPKGTDSQEYLKKEERKLLDIIDRRATKREEDEAKKKKEHPLKPFKLEKKQTVTAAKLTPDGKYVVAVVSNESEKAKKAIVPTYVTESAYTDTIPSREKVGDVQPPTRIAILNTASGEAKWFEHGLKSPQTKEESEQKTEKTEAAEKVDKPKDREVSLRMPLWSDDGKRSFVVIRSADNKDVWIMAFDPSTARGHTIATMHDDAWIRFDPFTAYGRLPDNQTISFPAEQTGCENLHEVTTEGGAPRTRTSRTWEG